MLFAFEDKQGGLAYAAFTVQITYCLFNFYAENEGMCAFLLYVCCSA
jgi:hypothetical protein